MVKRDTWERRAFSNPDFRDYRAQATASFAGLAAMDGANFNLTGDGEATRVRGERVSADYFAVLGVRPALGRTFTAEEDSAPGLAPLVVLSDRFWRTRLAASPDRSRPARQAHRRRLHHHRRDAGGFPRPRRLDPTLGPDVDDRRGHLERVAATAAREAVGRLKPGVTLEQARAELAAIGLKLASEYPQSNTNYSADVGAAAGGVFRQPAPAAARAAWRGRSRARHHLRERREPPARAPRHPPPRDRRARSRSAPAAARWRGCSSANRSRWRSPAARSACCSPRGSSPR